MIWGFQIREAVFAYFSFVIPLAGEFFLILVSRNLYHWLVRIVNFGLHTYVNGG